MTNEEIVARALKLAAGVPVDDHSPEADELAVGIVAALEGAGRLVPDGCVVISPTEAKYVVSCIDRDPRGVPSVEALRKRLDASET